MLLTAGVRFTPTIGVSLLRVATVLRTRSKKHVCSLNFKQARYPEVIYLMIISYIIIMSVDKTGNTGQPVHSTVDTTVRWTDEYEMP